MVEQIILVLIAVSITEAIQCVLHTAKEVSKARNEAKVLKAQKEKADAERRKNESAEMAAMQAKAVISADHLALQAKLSLANQIAAMTPEQLEAYNKTLLLQEWNNRQMVQYLPYYPMVYPPIYTGTGIMQWRGW